MPSQLVNGRTYVIDFSDSTQCFKNILGALFNLGGDIYAGHVCKADIIADLYFIRDLSKKCGEHNPDYEYNLPEYSEKCFMFDPKYSYQDPSKSFGDQQIVDCVHAMEPMRIVKARIDSSFNTTVPQGQIESTPHHLDIPEAQTELSLHTTKAAIQINQDL